MIRRVMRKLAAGRAGSGMRIPRPGPGHNEPAGKVLDLPRERTPSPVVLGLEPALPRPLRGWRWLTDPVPAERAAALRIAVAAVLLFDILVLYLPNLAALYGPGGFGDPSHFDARLRPALLALVAAAGSAAGAGARRRSSAAWAARRGRPARRLPAAAGGARLLGRRPCRSRTRTSHLHNGGDQLKLTVLLMLVFLPTDGRWAVRRHPAARGTAGPVLVRPWPIRLLMVQLAVMYFMNGYYKAMGPAWRDGSVMYYVAHNPSWAHFSPDYLPLPDGALRRPRVGHGRCGSCSSRCWWRMPVTRAATLWVGVFFHVGTLVHLEVGLFPLYALCYYVPLVPWERLTAATYFPRIAP